MVSISVIDYFTITLSFHFASGTGNVSREHRSFEVRSDQVLPVNTFGGLPLKLRLRILSQLELRDLVRATCCRANTAADTDGRSILTCSWSLAHYAPLHSIA